jgi:hypothetical protein
MAERDLGSAIFLIFFGWFLGLASPMIVEAVKAFLGRRELVRALRVELEDLQYRLAIASFQLLQTHGHLDKNFLKWLQPIVDRYTGDEPSQSIRMAVSKLIEADEHEFNAIIVPLRGKEAVGSSLKLFQANFLEAHVGEISKLPVSVQRRIHEFRNQLHILNQDIHKSDEYLKMTFTVQGENHRRVADNLSGIYNLVQNRCRIVADKIETVLSAM